MQTVTQLLKKVSPFSWAVGFLTLLIYQALDASLNNVLEALFSAQDGTPNWVWLIAGLSVLLNILFPVGISFWLLSSVKGTRHWAGDFQQMLIETLRVWGKILLYSLALIVPGIWKWVSSLFVPYVVLFSQKYQAGQADAIEASALLFKRVWLRSILVILVFSMGLPLILTTFYDQYREIWVHPLGAVLLGLVEYLSLLITLFCLLSFFIKASREVENELVF